MIIFDEELRAEKEQGDIIDKILEEVNIPGDKKMDAQYKEEIRGGICYALSMEWIRLVIENNGQVDGDFGAIEMREGTDGELVPQEESLYYYKQIANKFIAYAWENEKVAGIRGKTRDYSSIEMDEIMLGMATRDSVSVVKRNVVSNPTSLAQSLMDTNEEELLFIYLSLDSAAHQIAGYRAAENRLYIYDPNFGTIMVEGNNIEELKRKVERLVGELYSKYSIQSAAVKYIKRK